jgi:hypothetical protein
MPDKSSSPQLEESESRAVIDLAEEVVRDNAISLNHPLSASIFDPANVTRRIDDPIDTLAEFAHPRRHSETNEPEAAFVDAAARWAADNRITRDDCADLGVRASVLEPAFGSIRPRRGDRATSGASYGRVAAGICSKPAGTTMTIVDIKTELANSGTTVVVRAPRTRIVTVRQGLLSEYAA